MNEKYSSSNKNYCKDPFLEFFTHKKCYKKNCMSPFCLNTKYKCIHDQYKVLCTECKDKKIDFFCLYSDKCIHTDFVPTCQECRDKNYRCIHNKSKYHCRTCKTGICEHDKFKGSCKECKILKGSNGMSLCITPKPFPEKYKCIHGRSKYYCRDCRTGLCIHDKFHFSCKECRNLLCLHSTRKSSCNKCNKSKCTHGKSKFTCGECKNPSYRCEHNRSKYCCKDCKTGVYKIRFFSKK